jgi:hypothetical protein
VRRGNRDARQLDEVRALDGQRACRLRVLEREIERRASNQCLPQRRVFESENVVGGTWTVVNAKLRLINGKRCGVLLLPISNGLVPTDEDHEAARIRSLVQDAAEQLVGWDPSIVIIDTSIDRALMGRCCALANAMSETWASHLAAVFLVADTYPGFAMTIVQGPKYDAWALAQILGPRACEQGHVHVDTFGGPPGVCPLDRDFYGYPALCVPEKGHYWFVP